MSRVVRIGVCGFSSLVELLFVDTFPTAGSGAMILDEAVSLGADAALVARELSKQNCPVSFITNPIGFDSDGDRFCACLGNDPILWTPTRADTIATPLLRVFCDRVGHRTWFVRNGFAEPPLPSVLDESFAGWYWDFYSADWTSVAAAIGRIPYGLVYVNLAEDSFLDKLSALSFNDATRCFIQYSDEKRSIAPQAAMAHVRATAGLEAIILTYGSRGGRCVTDGFDREFGASRVRVVHSFGAGAAFSAGTLDALCRGASPLQACKKGASLAADYLYSLAQEVGGGNG